MTITNGYATLAQFKGLPEIASTDATDDAFIESLIERASRFIDGECAGRTFYARTSETRYFDAPVDRQLDLDDDLLALTTLTNGDGTAIASTDYLLVERNAPPYFAVRLKESYTEFWEPESDGDTEKVISVLGTWGYVDRAGVDFRSVMVTTNTTAACLAIALSLYRKRYGVNVEGAATITGAGVVITPSDVPKEAWRVIEMYRRRY